LISSQKKKKKERQRFRDGIAVVCTAAARRVHAVFHREVSSVQRAPPPSPLPLYICI